MRREATVPGVAASRNPALARTSLATAVSSATSVVSCGHQASETEQGGRSAIGTKVTFAMQAAEPDEPAATVM